MGPRILFIAGVLLIGLIGCPSLVAGQQSATLSITGAPDRAQNQLDFADGLYQRGLYSEAAKEYATFLQSYPKHKKVPTALFRRAECLYQKSFKNPKRRKEILSEAEGDLRTLLERFPQNDRRTEALLRRGEILCQIGRSAEAVPLLAELLQGPLSKTVEEAVRFHLGEAYWAQKKNNAAEKQWETLRKRFPKGELYAPATYSLAILKQQKKQLNKAIALLKELTAEKPRFPIPENSPIPGDARILLAQIYTQLGDHAHAAEMYLQASREPRHKISALYGRAWALLQQQDFDATVAVTRDLLKEKGLGDREAGVLFLLGTALYESKKYKEAVDPLQRFVVHPGAGDLLTQGWYRLVWSLFLTGDLPGASRQAESLLKRKLDPALTGDLHFVLAQIAATSNQYTRAATEYGAVVERFPASRFVEKAAYGVGEMEYRSGAYDRAATAFAAFVQKYPQSALYDEALRWLATSLLQTGQHKEAARRIEELIQRNPSHKELPGLLYRQGLALYKSGETQAMRAPFEELLKRFPRAPDAPKALYWLAWQDDEAGNTKRSLQEFARLLKEYPESSHASAARRRLAVGYMKTDQLDLALPLLTRIFMNTDEAKKVGPEIFFRAAIYVSEQGQHEEAIRILKRVAEVHSNPEVLERSLVERGRECVTMGRWREASDCANKLFEKFPHSPFRPEAYWIRARAFQGLDQFDDAEQAFKESLRALANLGSSDPLFEATLHLDWGKLLEMRSRPGDALKEYLYVDILFPDRRTSPEALSRAAICQEQVGKDDEARATLERLVKLYPDTPEAKKAKKRLAQTRKTSE